MTEAYPLHWPEGWPRTLERKRLWSLPGGRGATPEWDAGLDRLTGELRRLGAVNIVVSTNQPLRRDGLPYLATRRIEDLGAAVRMGFPFGGITFEEYRGQATDPDGTVRRFIAANEGHAFPLGTVETFAAYLRAGRLQRDRQHHGPTALTPSRSRASSSAAPTCTPSPTRCRCATAPACW